MGRRLLGAIAAGALAAILAVPAFAESGPGAQAPNFTAKASLAGKDFVFSLKKAIKKGPVVLYFYPSAYTGGCDLEAHTFATQAAAFAQAGATILGVSADDLQRLNAFSADPDYCAGAFPVASDADGRIAAAYGLGLAPPKPGATDVRGARIGHGFIPRVTFVIARDGRIVAALSSKADHLTPPEHVQRSLAIVQSMAATNSK